MANLRARGFIEPLKAHVAAQKPLLQLDQQLAALQAKRRTATIDLDQALGGGIAIEAPQTTASN